MRVVEVEIERENGELEIVRDLENSVIVYERESDIELERVDSENEFKSENEFESEDKEIVYEIL